MDADKPCRCPRCGWLGTIHDAEAYQPRSTSGPNLFEAFKVIDKSDKKA